jgi:U4/U6.U5 tri-snRNP-associated protein 2
MKRNYEENINEENKEIKKKKILNEKEIKVVEKIEEKEIKVEECPYLDTINKKMLEFDFEKVCCETLTNLNVYCCLICGKFYQGIEKNYLNKKKKGRGKNTPADYHSFQLEHHIFMNLSTRF